MSTRLEDPPELSKRMIVTSVVKRGGPRILEASIIPSLLFYTCLAWGSLGAAYVVAVVWTYGCLLRRVIGPGAVSGVLVLGAVAITVRTGLAVGSGSSFIYFAQPIVGTVVTGLVFLGSLAVGRPMASKLAHDFWPITQEQADSPRVQSLLKGLTLLWAGVNMATATMTFILLTSLPLASFIAAKQVSGLAITLTAIAVTIRWSHRIACEEGIVSARSKAREPGAAPVAVAIAA